MRIRSQFGAAVGSQVRSQLSRGGAVSSFPLVTPPLTGALIWITANHSTIAESGGRIDSASNLAVPSDPMLVATGTADATIFFDGTHLTTLGSSVLARGYKSMLGL